MARNHSHLFTEHENAMANFAKAMAHPARIRIVSYLLQQPDGMFCGDLVKALPLAQATVSQHLREMVAIGVLKTIPQGAAICYQLDPSQLLVFCQAFQKTLGNDPKKAS